MGDRDGASSPAQGYRKAGVDLAAAEQAKRQIVRRIAETYRSEVLRPAGHFGSFFRAPGDQNPFVLVSSADGVGTKVLIATLLERHTGIGIDIVNHCVNDILTAGAEPLFFLDYVASAGLDGYALLEVISGMTTACQDAGCALVGGETAQLPGIYQPGVYDLAGFIVGAVPEDRIVDGAAIEAGDIAIGLPSSGLHTNGFSLARQALGLTGNPDAARLRLSEIPGWSNRDLGALLLEPHRSYLPTVQPWLNSASIHGMAHITGGGLADNVSRIVPQGLNVVIDPRSWVVPPLFELIQSSGGIDDAEMYRVFNMGIGFVLVARPDAVDQMLRVMEGSVVIGRVERADPASTARVVGLPTAAETDRDQASGNVDAAI